MSHIVANFNMSGGVGKSTSTQNLAYHMATDYGAKVLIVDCDPQASLTTFMGFKPLGYKSSLIDAFQDFKTTLFIETTPQWCDLVPANIYLSRAEITLGGKLQKEIQLKKILDKVRDNYDIIIIDCLPSLSMLAINCMAAADSLLIPIQTEYKSLEATINLLKMTVELVEQLNPDLEVIGVMPTMYDSRLNQSKESLKQINEMFEMLRANPLFTNTEVFAPIPRSTQFANASKRHIPLAEFDSSHVAVETLVEIAGKILSKTTLIKGVVNG